MLALSKGKIRAGAVVNIAVFGVANAQPIFTRSTFASMVGVKTLKLKRLKIRNNNGPNTWVHIGTGAGAGFVERIPPLFSVANTTDDYGELDLPETEVLDTFTAYPDAIGAGSFDIQVEVEEIG